MDRKCLNKPSIVSSRQCFYYLTKGIGNKVLVEEALLYYFTNSEEESAEFSRAYYNTPRRSTLLQLAIAHGFIRFSELLIKKELDVNVGRYDSFGTYQLPLAQAISRGLFELVPIFFNNNSLVETFSNSKEVTPLSTAIKASRLDIAEELLKRGANINCFDHDIKGSLLHFTAGHNKLKETEWLLDHKINYCSNSLGQTPLHIACFNGSGKVVEYLIKQKYDLTCKDIAGHTPLAYASIRQQAKAVKAILNCFYPDESLFRDDLLYFFLGTKKDDVKLFFLGFRVKVNSYDHFLEKALITAMECGCHKVTEHLLLCGARNNVVNELSDHQNTPLLEPISTTNPTQIDRIQRLWTRDYGFVSLDIVGECTQLVSIGMSTPMRLKDISRLVIFKIVYTNSTEKFYWDSINKLPLPSQLKKFINYEDLKN